MTPETNIIVVGAGYAGLEATARLAMKTRRQNVRITLINPSDFFVERPRLHQFAANQPVKQRPIAEILAGTGVQFLHARVKAILARQRQVTVTTAAGRQRLAYDYLLYTAGSTIDLESVPGVGEHAFTLTPEGPRSAVALKSLLPELNEQSGQVLVVGGGPTGIEATAEFAESYPGLKVTLVTEGQLAGQFGRKIQAHIRQALGRLGVVVRQQTQVVRVERSYLVTRRGERMDFDLCLWAGGFIASPLARQAGLAVNERGQVLVDPFMRSISDPRIYAAGDSALPIPSANMPVRVRMAAYTAAITGAHTADCLADAIQGRRQKPLDFAYLGQGIALGRRDAVGFNNFPDDRPRDPIFTGLAGVLGREFFVKLLRDLPLIERRLPGLPFWPGRGLYRWLTREQPGPRPAPSSARQR